MSSVLLLVAAVVVRFDLFMFLFAFQVSLGISKLLIGSLHVVAAFVVAVVASIISYVYRLLPFIGVLYSWRLTRQFYMSLGMRIA